MSLPDSQSLILSPSAHDGIARVEGRDVVYEELPRWLQAALGPAGQPPVRVPADAPPGASPLARLAPDIRRVHDTGEPLDRRLLEFTAADGAAAALLVRAALARDAQGRAAVLMQVLDAGELLRERRKAAAVGAWHGIVGDSLPMLEVYHRIALYGPTEAPVVITGETGTGKELVARALHERSGRSQGPFVPVNCTALSPELFESELFGHEKGSFTGAWRQHRGRFERAHGGTLFLDEIGDMPPMTQSKLLRALEEGVIERVGSEQEQEVDVRVVAATNVALELAVAEGRFRADLFHRLNVFRIHLPPLRERLGDMPKLLEHYADVFNRRYNRSVRRFSPEAIRLLQEYHWPGNIRELRNVVERLFVETTGEAIGANALTRWIAEREFFMPGGWNADAVYEQRRAPSPLGQGAVYMGEVRPAGPPRHGGAFWGAAPPPAPAPPPLLLSPDDVVYQQPQSPAPEPARGIRGKPSNLEEAEIREAFAAESGNATAAAARLGVHKATLYRHMNRLGLTREELEGEGEG